MQGLFLVKWLSSSFFATADMYIFIIEYTDAPAPVLNDITICLAEVEY